MRPKLVSEIISSLLIWLFAYTAFSKLLDHAAFRLVLGKSPFVTRFAGVISWLVPTFEIMVTVLLLFNKTRLKGLYASFFLLSLFTGYIYAMLHYSDYLPCSCGGIISQMTWPAHLIFNISFIVICTAGIIIESGWKLSQSSTKPSDRDKIKNIQLK